VCITWPIDRHYRGGHPRTYLGPINTSNLENQTTFAAAWLATTLTSATSFRAAMNSMTLASGTPEMVAVHRVRDGAQLTVPLVSVIKNPQIDSRVDTMRRRLGRDR
jgi:hypothetical protein